MDLVGVAISRSTTFVFIFLGCIKYLFGLVMGAGGTFCSSYYLVLRLWRSCIGRVTSYSIIFHMDCDHRNYFCDGSVVDVYRVVRYAVAVSIIDGAAYGGFGVAEF